MNTIIKLNDSVYHIYESNGVYCTLVIGSERALLIDTGYGCTDLLSCVSGLTSKPVVLANTHGHFDHIQMNSLFPSVYIHKDDVRLLRKNSNLFFKYAIYFAYLSKMNASEKKCFLKTISIKSPKINRIIDGDTIDLGDTIIKVIEMPGHTKGSVCFLDKKNNYAYCGDTVSNHSWICLKESLKIGVYIKSLERIKALIDPSCKIVASHSDVPLNAIVLDKLIACAQNISIDKSTSYKNLFCKKSFIYCEGLDLLRTKYQVNSFEEMIQKIELIDKDVFRNGEFVSIVFRKELI